MGLVILEQTASRKFCYALTTKLNLQLVLRGVNVLFIYIYIFFFIKPKFDLYILCNFLTIAKGGSTPAPLHKYH